LVLSWEPPSLVPRPFFLLVVTPLISCQLSPKPNLSSFLFPVFAWNVTLVSVDTLFSSFVTKTNHHLLVPPPFVERLVFYCPLLQALSPFLGPVQITPFFLIFFCSTLFHNFPYQTTFFPHCLSTDCHSWVSFPPRVLPPNWSALVRFIFDILLRSTNGPVRPFFGALTPTLPPPPRSSTLYWHGCISFFPPNLHLGPFPLA